MVRDSERCPVSPENSSWWCWAPGEKTKTKQLKQWKQCNMSWLGIWRCCSFSNGCWIRGNRGRCMTSAVSSVPRGSRRKCDRLRGVHRVVWRSFYRSIRHCSVLRGSMSMLICSSRLLIVAKAEGVSCFIIIIIIKGWEGEKCCRPKLNCFGSF